eukprot:2135983-Alexandrium_andersonii.AAC.1
MAKLARGVHKPTETLGKIVESVDTRQASQCANNVNCLCTHSTNALRKNMWGCQERAQNRKA